ncbi:MAG: hypothetical protein GXO43_07190 [Crenarchaeota archaeon]|nr:hypothetical protein [Thermoproteota archaeon]
MPSKKVNEIMKTILQDEERLEIYSNVMKLVRKLLNGEEVVSEDIVPLIRITDTDCRNVVQSIINELNNKLDTGTNDENYCIIIGKLKHIAFSYKRCLPSKYIGLLDLCYDDRKCKALLNFVNNVLKARDNSEKVELFKLLVLSYKPEALEWCSRNRWDCERLALSICDLLYSMARLFNNRGATPSYYFPCVPMLGDILLLAYYLGGDTDINIDEIKLNIKVPSNGDIVSINLRKEYFS